MGIFEVLILISAAIIFIILVRRFPETAENLPDKQVNPTSSSRFRWRLPSVRLGSLLRRPASSPGTTFDDMAEPPRHKNTQPEPGTTPSDLEHISPELRQVLNDAQKYYELRQFDMAEKLYLKVAAESPRCVMAYNRLGEIYLERGLNLLDNDNPALAERAKTMLIDAEEAFYQALKYTPANGFILNNLGQIAYHKGHFNEAVKFYDQSLAGDERVSIRHANIGLAYLSLRQYGKAVRHLSRAWSLEPNNQHYKDLLDDAKERDRRQRSARS